MKKTYIVMTGFRTGSRYTHKVDALDALVHLRKIGIRNVWLDIIIAPTH